MMSSEQILKMISELYTQHIPFHEYIGVDVLELREDRVAIRIDMRPELVGNPFFQILHGGVTATLLDAAGGMIAMATVVSELEDFSDEHVQQRLAKLGTIDIRIDYLRPGRGNTFTATARVIRKGRKVAVTRMELRNDTGEEIALGTATYMVG